MKKIIVIFLVFALIIFGCAGGSSGTGKNETKQNQNEVTIHGTIKTDPLAGESPKTIIVTYYKESPVGYGPPYGEKITETSIKWAGFAGNYSVNFNLNETNNLTIGTIGGACAWKNFIAEPGKTYEINLTLSLCPP